LIQVHIIYKLNICVIQVHIIYKLNICVAGF